MVHFTKGPSSTTKPRAMESTFQEGSIMKASSRTTSSTGWGPRKAKTTLSMAISTKAGRSMVFSPGTTRRENSVSMLGILTTGTSSKAKVHNLPLRKAERIKGSVRRGFLPRRKARKRHL